MGGRGRVRKGTHGWDACGDRQGEQPLSPEVGGDLDPLLLGDRQEVAPAPEDREQQVGDQRRGFVIGRPAQRTVDSRVPLLALRRAACVALSSPSARCSCTGGWGRSPAAGSGSAKIRTSIRCPGRGTGPCAGNGRGASRPRGDATAPEGAARRHGSDGCGSRACQGCR